MKLLAILGFWLSMAGAANAATCIMRRVSTGACETQGLTAWVPTTPPGWTTVHNSWTPTPNYVKGCTLPDAGGYCYKRYVAPGSVLTLSAIGDFDVDSAAGYSFHIRYWQSYLTGTQASHLFDNASCSGGSFTAFGLGGGLWTFNTLTAWSTSCMVLRN